MPSAPLSHQAAPRLQRTTRAGMGCSIRQVMLIGRLPSWRTYWSGPRFAQFVRHFRLILRNRSCPHPSDGPYG